MAGGAAAGHLLLAATAPSSMSHLLESGAVAEIVILLISLLLVALLEGHLARKAGESEEKLEVTRSELDTAELRIAEILDGVSSGLALVDSAGMVAYLNRAGGGILGVSEDGVPRRRIQDRLRRRARLLRPDIRRARCGPPGSESGVLREAQGRRRAPPSACRRRYCAEDGGEDRGVIAIFQDLTDARHIEERLRHDDRLSALGEFAAGVAHEIRNPLNAIRGSIDLLKETIEPKGDEVEAPGTRVARGRPARHAATGRASVRQDGVGRARERPPRLARSARSPSSPAGTRRASPTTELDVEARYEMDGIVNAEQLRRALLNLTINALEAIEGAGKVDCCSFRRPTSRNAGSRAGGGYGAAVVVEDTGMGIPADKKNVVFQPFQTTKKGGTGLGLAIVDKIVQAHGGTDSGRQRTGQGQQVHRVPAGLELDGDSGTGQHRKEVSAWPNGRILVVDDEDSIREYLSMMLEREGYEVVRERGRQEGASS